MMEKMDKFDTAIWKLRDLEENSKCADCTDSFPRYINTTHGTFVCSVCGGIHREMGNRIKSTSDTFTQSDIDKLEKVGNKMAGEIWLSNWNQNQYPIPYPSDEKRVKEFIKMKYIEKKWIKDGVSPSDYISISHSTSTTPIVTSPKQLVQQPDLIINSSEKKDINSNSKISLSKEFESLSLGGSGNSNGNGLLNLQKEQQHLPNQQSNIGSSPSSSGSSNQQFDSNGKPFNPFRDENKYFNSKPVTEAKKSFPPFSEKPFDQHSYLTGNDVASSSSSFYSKIQLQQSTPKPPPTSIYESQSYQQRMQQEQQEQASQRAKQIQLQLQQQEQQMQQQQYNMMNSGNQMMNNGSQILNNNNNVFPQIQYNPFTESNNQLALMNQNDINSQQMINSNNNMQMQPQIQSQPQQMMNNFQQQHQQHQANLQTTSTNNIGNPFVSEQVILQHQAMHQQNMQQNQGNVMPNGQMVMNSNGQMIFNAPATTTTTTITHTPIGGNVASGSNNVGNPFDGSIEIYDESKLVYGKINNDPVFPASSASFESGNNLDRSDSEQKEAWRLIQQKNIQIQEDKNLASKLQIEEENLFKSQEIARKLQFEEEERFKAQTHGRLRSNTEPSRTTSSYNRSTSQQYIPPQRSLQSQQHSSHNDLSYGQPMTMSSGHHRSSSSGSSSIFKRLGRSRSKSYEDPFEIPQLNKSSDGFDDYDNYMKNNKRIPGGGENYQPKFPSQPQYQQQNYQHSQPQQQNQQDYYDDPYESEPISQQIVVHAPGTINQPDRSFTDCENCGKTVGLEAMSFHKHTECILRQERCSLCNKLIKHVQMADHRAQCQISTYTCGVCGRMIVGKDMPNHMSFVHNQ